MIQSIENEDHATVFGHLPEQPTESDGEVVRFLGNLVDALEINRQRLLIKSKLTTWSLELLIATLWLLAGYFIRTSL